MCVWWQNAKRKSKGEGNLFWTARFMWNDKGDTAVLKDASGEEIARVTEGGEAAGAAVAAAGPPSVELSLDLKEDTVTVKNTGESTLSVGGWGIHSDVGDQSYTFPDDCSIEAGEQVKVWSGKVRGGVLCCVVFIHPRDDML